MREKGGFKADGVMRGVSVARMGGSKPVPNGAGHGPKSARGAR